MDDDIDEQVRIRRKALNQQHQGASLPPGYFPSDESENKWGLALSGGGIRSATFCLGLIAALAHNKTLLRFDLLSTVSGGGYLGSAVGRLFSHAENGKEAKAIEDKLGDLERSRWYLLWLRANSRYLIPRGVKDTATAIAIYLRNLLGVHIEIGLVALLLGFLLVGVNLVAWWYLAHLGHTQPAVFDFARNLSPLLPVAWVLALIPLLVAAIPVAAYWEVAWLRRHKGLFPLFAWYLGLLVCAAAWHRFGLSEEELESWLSTDRYRRTAVFLSLGLLHLWLLGTALAAFALDLGKARGKADAVDDWARNWVTQQLALLGKITLLLVIAGLIDRVAWTIAFERGVISTGLWLAVLAAVARVAMPMFSSMAPGELSTRAVLGIARILGYAATFLLFAWWISLVHKAVMTELFSPVALVGPSLNFAYARESWAAIFLPVVAYLLLTGRNLAFLNLSSMHAFYRARLSRSYLGAVNPKRFAGENDPLQGANLKALETVPGYAATGFSRSSVDAVTEEDNILLGAYLPQRSGGPVHILNTCINQTTDPRGGLFNQDRRGLMLSVASGGFRQISRRGWAKADGVGEMSLATWMAISGAAFAPGLGHLTRGGVSALAMFAGVRLGYWWDRNARTAGAPDKSRPHRKQLIGGCGRKSEGVVREMFGNFAAGDNDDWFITDGGHFENTGAYALLAKRTKVIVLADCGADPKFRFEDVENLVRRARIDLQAQITFQRPKDLSTGVRLDESTACVQKHFGSINDLFSSTSTACLALACIKYSEIEDKDEGSTGILILVKPNICAGLPVDLINFKRDNPSFPQQSTADQFFSEAQWESYFLLGQYLGQSLEKKILDRLLASPYDFFKEDDRLPFDENELRPASPPTSPGSPNAGDPKRANRLPIRIVNTNALGTTITLGAAATIGVGAWQAIDGVRASFSQRVEAEHKALKELTSLWAAVAPNKTATSPGTETAGKSDANTLSIDAAAQSAILASAKARDGSVTTLAAAIVHTADTLCPSDQADWFTRSPLARTILRDAQTGCEEQGTDRSNACKSLLSMMSPTEEETAPKCLIVTSSGTGQKPRYWAYGYGLDANLSTLHPCDSQRQAWSGDKGWLESISSRKLSCANAPVLDPVVTAQIPTVTSPSSTAGPTANTGANKGTTVPMCTGKTIKIRIYGPELRDQVRVLFRDSWRALGASVPPIEDVNASSRAKGKEAPPLVLGPTILYSGSSAADCAAQMINSIADSRFGAAREWSRRDAPELRATPDTIQVWIPPYWFAAADKKNLLSIK